MADLEVGACSSSEPGPADEPSQAAPVHGKGDEHQQEHEYEMLAQAQHLRRPDGSEHGRGRAQAGC